MISRTGRGPFTPAHPRGTLSMLSFLLAEEQCAVDAYAQALEHRVLPRHPEPLRELLSEHQQAYRHLRDYSPEPSSGDGLGAWYHLPRVVEAGVRFHVREAVLWALRNAEERSVSDFEECLGLEGVSDECQGLIRTELLPKARKHLHQLDELIRLAAEEVELM